MRSRLRLASPLLVGAALLLVLLRVAGDRSAPPLYEGIPKEEPYRYLHPAPGQTGQPHSASQTVAVAAAQRGGLELTTPNEAPPQATFLIGAGALALPPEASSITETITLVERPATAPKAGHVEGNVYRIGVVSNTGADVPLAPGQAATVILRGPFDVNDATMERYDGTAWTSLHTDPIGEPHTFAANTTSFGDFALVVSSGTAAPSGGEFPWYLAVIGAAAVVLALLLLRRPLRFGRGGG